mmetsp:Transcript_11065/g.26623  ORF Transcript_11065/g.26623 Transcript_11065/m.26623 type:complete len:215 (+) Transcript_11065:295-939(+)
MSSCPRARRTCSRSRTHHPSTSRRPTMLPFLQMSKLHPHIQTTPKTGATPGLLDLRRPTPRPRCPCQSQGRRSRISILGHLLPSPHRTHSITPSIQEPFRTNAPGHLPPSAVRINRRCTKLRSKALRREGVCPLTRQHGKHRRTTRRSKHRTAESRSGHLPPPCTSRTHTRSRSSNRRRCLPPRCCRPRRTKRRSISRSSQATRISSHTRGRRK